MRLTIKHCHWCGEMGHVKEDCPSSPGRDEIARLKADNARLRTLLWSHHGHKGIYGDDGERQCSECGFVDFKRDTVDRIEEAFRALAERIFKEVSHD